MPLIKYSIYKALLERQQYEEMIKQNMNGNGNKTFIFSDG